jgi:hypothetical protein
VAVDSVGSSGVDFLRRRICCPSHMVADNHCGNHRCDLSPHEKRQRVII